MSPTDTAAALPNFVGREHEVKQFMRYLDQADRGQGRVVLVRGEAGVGKSTLISVVLTEAAARYGAFCARGQCLDQDAPVPYLPFTDALRTYFGLAATDGPDAVTRKVKQVLVDNAPGLISLVPVVGGILAAGIGIGVSVQREFGFGRSNASAEKDKLFYSLYELAKRISQKQPVVLMLDDLHWADKASLDLLHFLAREVRQDRILLIGAYRPEGLHGPAGKESHLAELRRRLGREELLYEIALNSFGKAETRKLVEVRLPNPALPDSFYGWLFDHTEGNPYYADQLLKALVEKGALVESSGSWTLAGPLGELTVPENLHDLLQSRLKGVDEAGKDMLLVAAAIGYQFAFSLLQCASGKSEDDLCEHLQQALQLDLLKEQPLDGDDGFHFVHSLWREALYEKIPAFKRHRVHRKIAECLECLFGDRKDAVASQLAHHYRRAGNNEQAVRFLQIAAQGALKVLALEDAVHYYDTAIEILGSSTNPASLSLLLARGEVHYDLSHPQESKTDFQSALRLATALEDERAAALSQLRIGQVMSYWESDWVGATPLFLEAIPRFERAEDVDCLVQSYRWLGNSYEFGGKWAEAEVYYNKALETARQAGLVTGEAVGLSSLGYLAYIRGDWPEAIAKLKQSAGIMEEQQMAPSLAYAYRWLALTYEDMGDYQTAISYLEREVEVRQKVGQRNMPGTHLALGSCYLKIGKLDLAQDYLERALAQTDGPTQLRADAESFYGQLWLARGWRDLALEYALKSIVTYEQAQYPEMLASGKMYLGLVYAAMGEAQKAIEVSVEGLQIALELDAKKIAGDLYGKLGGYFERLGQLEQARTHYMHAAEIYRRLGADRFLVEVDAALERLGVKPGAS